jgi:hypothetical protein
MPRLRKRRATLRAATCEETMATAPKDLKAKFSGDRRRQANQKKPDRRRLLYRTTSANEGDVKGDRRVDSISRRRRNTTRSNSGSSKDDAMQNYIAYRQAQPVTIQPVSTASTVEIRSSASVSRGS